MNNKEEHITLDDKLFREREEIERIENYIYNGRYTSAMYFIEQLSQEKRPALYAGVAIAVAYAHDRLAAQVPEEEATLSKELLSSLCLDLAQKSGYFKQKKQ